MSDLDRGSMTIAPIELPLNSGCGNSTHCSRYWEEFPGLLSISARDSSVNVIPAVTCSFARVIFALAVVRSLARERRSKAKGRVSLSLRIESGRQTPRLKG